MAGSTLVAAVPPLRMRTNPDRHRRTGLPGGWSQFPADGRSCSACSRHRRCEFGRIADDCRPVIGVLAVLRDERVNPPLQAECDTHAVHRAMAVDIDRERAAEE